MNENELLPCAFKKAAMDEVRSSESMRKSSVDMSRDQFEVIEGD